ncbi:hypothetical protein TWF718_000399 [Orbilia javanica]|uniref:Uncharacterized protein n=1 Tax=Orbilia javanica TaxID=47235 RepID=A0AAN8RRL7_9PEZI
MFSRLAPLNRVPFRSLRANLTGQRRRPVTDSAISNLSVQGAHAAIPIIIAEFKKANIRITKAGAYFLQNTYGAGVSSKDIKNYLYTNGSGSSVWRSQQTFYACIDFNVFKIWEALYSRSDLFKEIIDKDEEENEKIGVYRDRWGSRLQDYVLWEWLSHMLTIGIIETADVDNLPEPYKLKGPQRKSDGVARVRGDMSSGKH